MATEATVLGEASALPSRDDARSAVAIVASLWEKVESLVQLEIKLGLAEAQDKLDVLKRELVAKAIGGAIVFAGMLTLVAAVVALLALKLPLWLAAALTGASVLAAGFALLRRPHPNLTLPMSHAQTQTPLTAASNTQGDE